MKDADRAGDAATAVQIGEKVLQLVGSSTEKLKRQADIIIGGAEDAAKLAKDVAQVVGAADKFEASGSGSKRDCESCLFYPWYFTNPPSSVFSSVALVERG